VKFRMCGANRILSGWPDVWLLLRIRYERELTGNVGFNFMQLRYPGKESSFFFAPSRTRLHRISQPVFSTKVGKHHRRKNGGGVEPINNWSKPQLSSKLYIVVSPRDSRSPRRRHFRRGRRPCRRAPSISRSRDYGQRRFRRLVGGGAAA